MSAELRIQELLTLQASLEAEERNLFGDLQIISRKVYESTNGSWASFKARAVMIVLQILRASKEKGINDSIDKLVAREKT
jgi:hypothetical protein